MKRIYFVFKIFVLIIFLPNLQQTKISAQDVPPQFVRKAVDALIKMINSEGTASIEEFINNNMVADKITDRKALAESLALLRTESKDIDGDISVEAEPNGIKLFLSGNGKSKKLMIELGPEGIYDLYQVKTFDPIVLTDDNLSETFNQLDSEGMAGVIYIRRGNKVIFEKAFGMANKELGIPNSINTVFGTGSRPIDYTVAGIYLLNQRGKIGLDDSINKYFDNVPQDKNSITIRYLLTGKSGLPDFFHTSEDWDPDLAWVDRKTAEKRLLNHQLLFTPGSDRQHSHGAFVLLAALIERISGMDYYSFIRKNFFDPAGMSHTGEYGEIRDLSIKDFATGGGPQFVGLPNIPPNWGPTSWLVKGSGGMYSNLDNLLKFYDYIRSEKVLDKDHNKVFNHPSVNLDGSDRGFELFSAYVPPDSEIYLFINSKGKNEKMKSLFQALEKFSLNKQ